MRFKIKVKSLRVIIILFSKFPFFVYSPSNFDAPNSSNLLDKHPTPSYNTTSPPIRESRQPSLFKGAFLTTYRTISPLVPHGHNALNTAKDHSERNGNAYKKPFPPDTTLTPTFETQRSHVQITSS